MFPRPSVLRLAPVVMATAVVLGSALVAGAQDGETRSSEPAFSLSTSQIFTSKDAPHFHLTFRRLPSLDFRVYKVRDPFAFFAGLRRLHEMGTSGEADVPQELTAIERFANWKRRQRSALRDFLRGQISSETRTARTEASDRAQTAQRVRLNVSTFAQVPLLNPEQLVTSWRELLPNHRDSEVRRVPLEVQEPGVYVVEAVNGLLRAYTIAVVSDVGLVTKTSPGQIVMFAANRFTGEPAAGCEVRVQAAQKPLLQGTTTADGTFDAAVPETRADEILGLTRCGDQIGVTDPGSYGLQEPARELVGYVYTDKPIYRPGHTVHTKAVLRWRERDALRLFDQPEVEITVSDVNDKVLLRRRLAVDRFGAVEASVPVPLSAALGRYSIRISSGDRQATGAFEVQEYRRPEFEVIATPAARFVVQGREAVVTVQARYYFGQPVANAELRWVANEQFYVSPLRWSDDAEDDGPGYFYGGDQTQQGTVRLDANGRAELRVRLAPRTGSDTSDYSARIEAQVTDASGRQVSGSTIVHATRGTFLLSTRTGTSVLPPGGRVAATVDALDYVGTPQPNVPVTFNLNRVEYRSGYYNEPVITTVSAAQVVTDAKGHAETSLTLPAGVAGSFRVTATAMSTGRMIQDDAHVWVPGAADEDVSSDQQYLELIADQRSYKPGDTATLVVRGEPVSGPIFLTKEGQHVSWYRVVRLSAGTAIEVPIEAGDEGDVYVSLAYLRNGRLFRADRRLGVPASQRTLQVTVTADQAVAKPQDPGTFTIRVADHTGAPVQAQVSLAVIDEAVYGVKPDETPDPVRFFYRREYTRVNTAFSRDYYFTGYSGRDRLQLASRRRRPFTLADFKGDKPAQPQVRKEFPDAIYWLGDLVTNAAGEARMAVKYPDTLTTWRLTARALTVDTRAGTTVARTTTTKDLIVRVITPRFLTEGDDVVLPTLVHNYRADQKTATVTIAATGLEPGGAPPTPTTATLAAGAERRDDWRFGARAVGTASVTASAKTDSDSDAVELPLPVVPYGVRRDATASGSLTGTGEATASVVVPPASNPAARSIAVAVAPSMAGSLLGALDFLTGYPYGCTEQTLSSFLPNLLVTRALTELKLAPTERLSALDRMVSAGVQRLGEMQHDDGGWGWWPSDANHPFMTAYTVWGLDEARRAGVKVESVRLLNGLRALARQYAEYPRAVPDLKAYMVYVLQHAGGDRATIDWFAPDARGQYHHAAARDDIWAARDRMSAYGRALLLLALQDANDARANELAPALEAEAVTTGELSYWTSDNDPLLGDSVDTRVEATALAVQALVRRNPRSPLLERAVRYLLLNRSGGYWGSTKQTAMAIYGLLAFMQARGETAQPFAVDVFVNGTLAGRRSFSAAALTAPDPEIVTAVARPGANDVRIVKRDGGGTAYWSAVGTYYDVAGAAARSGSRQLAISRRYAVLTPVTVQNRIVYRETPFTGTAKPGDVLTVRLTVAGSRDWRYLAIEDPLPAGVESIQDTMAYPLEHPNREWWWGSHAEYRDQRTVFFQEGFENGRYEYLYFVRVTSEGAFRAAPAQVSPMYVPGVLASSEPATLTVTAPPGPPAP
jgi:alpha-2-macroglobulin